ncbi:hypothetical protein DFH07DRAFT_818543 [Mycena maculata]|uniref:Autophagy-related protein 29 n=1 Tax=Mycena maculata TaxID=230809 RepID=A0AAD7NG82_9AGAR|nr:hypothetical protein DFH07DRAFT_818543 [Mycena maculata]
MPTATPAPNMRVVVRLPWNRPEHPLPDPPRIEWTSEKADILWKVIERSRSTDNGGTDWKGLAAHLEVPLPYLLYRVHARFQEELRGLQEIPGVSSPSAAQPPTKPFDDLLYTEKHTVASRAVSRLNGSGSMSPSGRLSTPLGVRARLSSLGNNSPRPKKATSSSTLTVQAPKKVHRPLSPTSSASSEDGTDSEDEEAKKEEEADRNAEEQEALDRKLQELQQMVTNEALGLVSAASRPDPAGKGKAKEIRRGRMGPATSAMQGSSRRDNYSSPLSVSSASSAQGSIPDIPSPPTDSQPHSPISRHLSPSKSSSPPALSPRSALGQSHRRYGPLVERGVSEQGSNHGSEASSFSDISDTSLSASALESALLSNIRGNGSRFSAFARSRLVGRGGH